MKLLSHDLASAIADALRAAQAAGDLPTFDLPEIDIRPPKHSEMGDYGTAIPLALTKQIGAPPLKIAEAIATHFNAPDFISAVEPAAPGFVNFRLDESWVRQQVETIIAEGDALGTLTIGAGKRALVEFVSANPTGPITIGRSRGGVIGDAMARLLDAGGYTTEREYYFNNAGAQMRNLGNSLRLRYLHALDPAAPLPSDNDPLFYQGDYLIDFANDLVGEHGDALKDADWSVFKEYAERKMFGWIRDSLARVRIHHDHFFNEASLYEDGAVTRAAEALTAAGHTYRAALPEDASPEERAEAGDKGEALWFRSTTFGDDKDRVIIKSSGEPTYTLPDIAYHLHKLDRGYDLLVNVLGADHGTQTKVVNYGVRALDHDPSKINVIINQMVRTVRNGKEVRMSTRRGVYDTLDDLIDQTSADAVRYMLLARSANTHLNFDLDLAVKQTNDNPVYYIQYAYVRCAGIFREAAARGVSDTDADVSLLGAAEAGFLRKVLELPEVVEASIRFFEPHRIAFYAMELANAFHPVFDEVRVLHSEVPPDVARARLRFYRAAQTAFRRVLTLMGMSCPEMM